MANVDPSAQSGDHAELRGTAPRAGSVLADRYRLVRQLGSGGMGSVWEAEHTQLGTTVAVKLIKPQLLDNPRARERFVREARSAAGLRSPYVVQIFDYGVEADTPFIVMERLEGETLAERLRREGTLSPPQVVSLIEQIARALTKAHAAKVVHRDLKPDNVFIVRDDDGERCKVLDFGIAKVLPGAEVAQAQTHSGMVLGTPYYMSPEQATNASDVDERADLWSMAIITYECLVGERPFDGATLPALAVKLLVDPIPVPSEHGRVPIGFDAWFGRATSRDPEQRFGSAAALARALATALEVEALSGSVMALPEPGARSHGRHWLIGMGVVLTVVLATWWVWSHRAEVPTVVDGTAAPAAGVVDVPPSTPAPVAEAEPSVAPPLAHSVDLADASPVELRLVGPAGAAVWHDTAQLGTLPDVISLPRSDTPITLRVAAVGFDDLLFEVVPNTDQQHTLQLTKVRSPAKPPRTKPPRPPGKSTVDDLEF